MISLFSWTVVSKKELLRLQNSERTWNLAIKSLENHNESLERPRYESCPCLHTTPCHPRCTCVSGASSRGCVRCCSYGSKDQQRRQAEWLALKIDAKD